MPTTATIAAQRLTFIDVNAATRWCFVEVAASDGLIGTGEATLFNQQAALANAFHKLAAAVDGKVAAPATSEALRLPEALPEAAILSALDQALWDIEGQRQGKSVADLLGRKRSAIALYANINRRTQPRLPERFAISARDAYAAGFRACKIAPFDEVTPATASLDRAAPGLARIAAARAALPEDAALYVDCHWRFTPDVAADVLKACAGLGVTWFECPILETEDAAPLLKALRTQCNARGMVLAGRETGIGVRAFQAYAEAGAYDVMMPDVKYAGGLREMLRIGDLLARHGIAMSPHNPTGPVCHAASLQVSAALGSMQALELQFDETPLFDSLVTPPPAKPVAGTVTLPAGPGIGCRLVQSVVGPASFDRITVGQGPLSSGE